MGRASQVIVNQLRAGQGLVSELLVEDGPLGIFKPHEWNGAAPPLAVATQTLFRPQVTVNVEWWLTVCSVRPGKPDTNERSALPPPGFRQWFTIRLLPKNLYSVREHGIPCIQVSAS